MSQLDIIRKRLATPFEEGHRLVFWQDPGREFEESLVHVIPPGIHLLRLDREPALLVKSWLELEAPTERYLLYQPGSPPPTDEDWFLDMRLYAVPFAADSATMHLRELELNQQSLRDHLAERASFLANKDRVARLKRFIQPDDGPDEIDKAIMAVLSKADRPDFFSIVIALLQELDEDAPDLAPTSWSEVKKYGLEQPFWRMVEEQFGYREENPSLRNFLLRMMVSDFDKSLQCALPDPLRHLTFPAKGAANAVVCLGQWRDSTSRSHRYEILSGGVADIIRLEECLLGLSLEVLGDVKTFLVVEKAIASQLRNRVLETAGTINLEDIRNTVSQRRDGYWASASDQHRPMRRVYDALLQAAELFNIRNRLGHDGLNYATPQEFHQAYTRELYRLDQLYRLFTEASVEAKKAGWDILKPLHTEVEACYGNWFVRALAINWSSMTETMVQKRWHIPEIPGQQVFYERHVQHLLPPKEERRVFVIISDALRFEAAQELTDQLNGKYRFTAELSSQLGVLPSYTALGMATLLPHKRLDYTDNGSVLVDGQSSSGLEQRGKILESVQGTALKADALMAMKKPEGREFIRPYRVIYIYHNRIDAIGDTASSEEETFQAVRETINELTTLVSKMINDLNATNILVTSDHGFLFQMEPPSETDKNALANKPPGTILSKKRYLLGRDLPVDAMAIRGSTNDTAGTTNGLDFWVPKGASRFHFVGGARFVHGGATLQEIVVPIIKIQQVKGKSVEATKVRTVGLSVLGNTFKVTTNRHRFILIQNEAVSERVKPVRVRVAIFDGENPITNVESVTFDSSSEDMNEWRKEVRLTLASRTFDKRSQYQLIVRNTDTEVEELRMGVTIDMAFSNDF
ncbi:MAG: BREX-1 system phosphatase PglZ type A [Magnetococcales bacterium]|nr:BREX-1 system phosphatase PglZ type A [Magnetococcales bacterium]